MDLVSHDFKDVINELLIQFEMAICALHISGRVGGIILFFLIHREGHNFLASKSGIKHYT